MFSNFGGTELYINDTNTNTKVIIKMKLNGVA